MKLMWVHNKGIGVINPVKDKKWLIKFMVPLQGQKSVQKLKLDESLFVKMWTKSRKFGF